MRDRVATYFEKSPRSCVRQIACCAAFLVASACSNDFSADPVIEYSAEHAIDGNNPAIISRELPPGSYLIEAREIGIDLRLAVSVSGSRTEIEDAVPRHGLHATVVSLSAPAMLRIELLSADHRTKRGRAAVRIGRWDHHGAAASERELAFTAFGIAGQQTFAGTKNSWIRAAEALHEATAHFEAARDDAGRAQAQYTLGHLQYLLRDDRQAAVRAADEAAALYRRAGDQVGEQNTATMRAASELEIAAGMNASTQRAEQRALYDAADRRLEEAADYFTKHDLPINAEYAVNMRGIRALYFGDHELAGQFFSRAVTMARANGDVAEQVKSLANLAWVHNRLGFVAEAAKEYSQLIPLIEHDRQPALYAGMLSNYGYCLISLGDFDHALELHTEALQTFIELGQEFDQARQLAAIGALYFRAGDLQRSLDALRSAIEVQERIGDGIGQASALRVAGNAASELEQHDVALSYLRKSAQIDVNPHSVARTRVLIASELRAVGDLKGAESEIAQALQSSNLLARAEALDERGRLRLAQKNLPAAIADLRAADHQYVNLGLDFNRIDTDTALSKALLANNDVAGALSSADEAISIVSRIRVKSANPEWRARFLSARYLPYEARIAAEFADAGRTADETSWRAFRISEEVRARSLADLLAGESRRVGSSQDPHGDALRAKLTELQLRLEAHMQRQDADEAGALELRREIVETRAQIDANRLKQDSVTASESTLTDSLRKLQSQLPADTAVLAYFVGDDATHAWLLSRRVLRHVVLGGRLAMARTADEFVGTQRRRAELHADQSELARKILGELFSDATERRMLVIPDGPLNGLPFAALPLPGGKPGELLVDRFVLSYAPSLALALHSSKEPLGRRVDVAVVSDPIYASDDRRLFAANSGAGNLRGPIPVSPNKLTRLPYSALEARAVANVFGGINTIQLSGFDATTSRVLALAAKDLAVLHFATHAAARRDTPDQSALYLSEYTRDGKLLEDSKLTVAEITRSGLRADVVVLSGCETGDGGRLRGEGVVGLAYGFLANGSRSVVAALWPIEDAATAKFMNEFYGAYRANGRTAEALRRAQLRMRGSVAPAVWSSFVVRANAFP